MVTGGVLCTNCVRLAETVLTMVAGITMNGASNGVRKRVETQMGAASGMSGDGKHIILADPRGSAPALTVQSPPCRPS